MTVTPFRSVGFCAHYSKQGDWAFEFALGLARRLDVPLNVFHFLEDPYEVVDNVECELSDKDRKQLAIEGERKLRFYYDEKAGDYLEVGFRLCEDREWTELHRCLCRREFQVLVLVVPYRDAIFGGWPIEDFAHRFVCPTVLIGPESPSDFAVNRPASLFVDLLGLEGKRCRTIGADSPGPKDDANPQAAGY